MKTKTLLTAILIIGTMTAYCQIINVPGDQPTIQAGIDAATTGDTVLVAQGTYFENINFNGKAITVASHYVIEPDSANILNTIINGSNPVNPDYASVVTFLTGEDTTSVLSGFTITGGSGMYLSSDDARTGGGIVCYFASAKIIHNIIEGNEVNYSNHAWGAGMASIKESGNYWTVVTDNIVRDNQAIAVSGTATGGGMEIWGSARICSNRIEDNHCISETGFSGGGGVISVSINNPPDTVHFINNTIRYNSTSSNDVSLGGGVSLWYSDSYLADNVINHNTVSGSEADGGGVHFYYPGVIEFEGNLISYNQVSTNNIYWGAGVVCLFPTAKADFRNNEFSYNSGPIAPVGAGGGMSIVDAYDVEVIIEANLFLNNTAYHGGGFLERSSYNLLITNNLFSENITFRGGGIGLYHPASGAVESSFSQKDYRPQVTNNTFFSNSASSHAGAIRFNGVLNAPVILNCIFWGNEAPEGKDISNLGSDTLCIYYSNIDTVETNNHIVGLWKGANNIYADPGFIDDSCHIHQSSPCIEAGVNSVEINGVTYFCPDRDIDGQIRPLNATAEIGVDEVLITGITKPSRKTENPDLLNVYPNPFSNQTSIQFTLPDAGLISLSVYDITGKQLETILGKKLSKGDHQFNWNAEGFHEGIYFIRLETNTSSIVQKVVILK